jgi:hypothetical protein
VVDFGLAASPEDLVVTPEHVAEVFDAAAAAALPDRGVLLLGEQHLQPATHTVLRRVIRNTRVFDCLLVEHPAVDQPKLQAYVLTDVCPEDDGVPSSTCDIGLRRRLLRSARTGQRAVYAVDACTHCPPYTELFDNPLDGPPAISDDDLRDVLLGQRNIFMADQIADLLEEGRCTRALMQTGRAHFRPPPGWGLGHVDGLDDQLRARDIPVAAWPIVDVRGEAHHEQVPRPARIRFVQRNGQTTAVFAE